MSTQDNSPVVNTIEFAGMLGRIEANIANLANLTKDNSTHLHKLEERLRSVETAVAQTPDDSRVRDLERKVETLEATKPVTVPWWTIAAGIASLVAIVSFVLYFITQYLVP